MYAPPLSASNRHVASWSHRLQKLKARLSLINADVCCLQEVAPDSFAEDFKFMAEELGYDGCELFKKGRFRPATFWRKSKCDLASPASHKDRTLLTAFKMKADGEEAAPWFVLNCHLQAGKEGKRRLQQIQEGTKAIMTLAKKLKVPDPEKVIICGDFNGGAECAAVRFLEDGFVDEMFVEDGESVTSARKELPLNSPLEDVMRTNPLPTMCVAELISQTVQGGSSGYENPILSERVVERLKRIFSARASHHEGGTQTMCLDDVQRWLIDINGQVGRGDEYREAARQMGWVAPPEAEGLSSDELKKMITLPTNGSLTMEGFIAVYQRELSAGKFWGINHDLAIMGEPLEDLGLFTARYDRMYCTGALKAVATWEFRCDKPCPNADEPSDHLPVAACFVMR
jgi:hypothetical protein